MNTRIAVLVALLGLVAVSQVAGDTYVHNPRGSNNRLNERSANRNNGNRVFDSQVRKLTVFGVKVKKCRRSWKGGSEGVDQAAICPLTFW